MAFIHEGSCECTKSELDLFSVPPTQTSMEQGSWVEYHPLTTVRDGGPIEFEISGRLCKHGAVCKGQDNCKRRYQSGRRWVPRIYFCTVCFRKWTFLSMERSSPLPLIPMRKGHVGNAFELWRRLEEISVDVCAILQGYGR